MTEEYILNNVRENYTRALSKKIYLDNLSGLNVALNPSILSSICLYNIRTSVFDLKTKCNHLFLYSCNGVTIKVDDCVSGITCMNCLNCNLLFKRTPDYNVEISNSYNIELVSMFFSMPLVFNSVKINIVKSVDCVIHEYYTINDGMFGRWNYNFFNF